MLSHDRLLVQILLLSLLGACLWVLAPFMTALFWAAVLAFASWPIMRVLTRALKGNTSLAAGVLTSAWVLIVAGPLVWLGFNIADYIRASMEIINNLRITGLPRAPVLVIEVGLLCERLI